MVIPLGGVGLNGQQDVEPPAVVKTSHVKFWWGLVSLLAAVTLARFIVADILGGFLILIMAVIAGFNAKDNCKNMTQCCLLSFGFLCAVQLVFELIPLLSSVGGRTQRRQVMTPVNQNQVTYTITFERHNFFDGSMPWKYNMESSIMIACPVVMLLGAVLCYYSYNAYPNSLFSDEGMEGQPFGGGYAQAPSYGQQGAGGGGGFGSSPGYQQPQSQQQPLSGGRAVGRPATTPQMFSGQGQRLGSG